jgi:hypothetical protein
MALQPISTREIRFNGSSAILASAIKINVDVAQILGAFNRERHNKTILAIYVETSNWLISLKVS